MPPRKKKAQAQSRGLSTAQVGEGAPSAPAQALRDAVEKDGGTVLSLYRDPLGGHWQILAALPIDGSSPRRFSATSPRRTSSG